MRAIRKINPHAHLVQTDDLGKVFSTPCLMYQAAFENERRWLTWDLLCGRINRQHPLWGYLRFQGGLAEADLTWFLENPCPPDIIGINHYLTSERFLDDRLEHYPPHLHGGNGRHGYADVEAVRVRTEGIAGISALLQEAWQRYQIPLAITEVHLGCTREEQLRWLQEVWTATQSQRQTGVDVQAVTVWSLLGAFDWHCLVTRCEGRYEPGVFDLRSPQPRPTALAAWVRNVTSGQLPAHPVLETPGWWQRPERLLYAAAVPCASPEKLQGRPLLITGRTGTLGQAFARICTQRGLAHRVVTRQELDIALPDSVEAALLRWKPWAVINTAGYVRVDEAETEVVRCQRENTLGPLTLAQACASHGIGFLTFSSDLVFNGQSRTPYREPDEVAPLNVYGRSKAAAEQVVLATMPTALVVRTSAFFGPWDASNFVTVALRTLQEGQTFLAAEDAVVSPTYVPDLVHAALDLLVDGEHGLWHLANAGNTTWAALARQAADRAGLPVDRVQACPTAALHLPARRPLFSALGSERGLILPTLDDALERYFQHRPWQSHVSPAGTPA
jgi:dTDP-4-dehydrorhamnose reductase